MTDHEHQIPIRMSLPRGAIVKGELYPTKHPDYLDSDLLEIRLPSGVFIDVGWYPAHDPNGQFVVSVFREDWDHPLQDEEYTTDIAELIRRVEDAAARY